MVFKRIDKKNWYLLVRANSPAQEWVLPKGHIEKDESAAEAAVREVREESGVVSEIRSFLDDTSFVVAGEQVRVAYYLMSAVKEGKSGESRTTRWCKLEEALKLSAFKEVRQMLVKADELLAHMNLDEVTP